MVIITVMTVSLTYIYWPNAEQRIQHHTHTHTCKVKLRDIGVNESANAKNAALSG